MAQGISSAMIAQMLLFCMLVLHSEIADADSYKVGDARGWTLNVANWTYGKRFKAGDTLVFDYPVGAHNVVVVDGMGYDSCTTPPGSPVYESGHDQIQLAHRSNYFISNFPGQCEAGMKIAIYAI